MTSGPHDEDERERRAPAPETGLRRRFFGGRWNQLFEAPPAAGAAPPSPRFPRALLAAGLVVGGGLGVLAVGAWLRPALPPEEPRTVAPTPDAAAPDVATPVDAARECQAEYDAHMAAATAFAKKRKHKDAIAELTGALTCRPDDPEALAERGYSKHFMGDHEGANDDLATASTKTVDKKLLSRIWFRRGLVYTAIWDAEAAKPAFAASYAFAPTETAKERAGGHYLCALEVDRSGSVVPIASTPGVVTDGLQHGAADLFTLFPSLAGWDSSHKAIPADGRLTEQSLVEVVGHGLGLPGIFFLQEWSAPAYSLVYRRSGRVWGLGLGGLTRVWNTTGESDFSLETTPQGLHAHGHLAELREASSTGPNGEYLHGTMAGPVTEVDAFVELGTGHALVVRRPKPGHYSERDTAPSAVASLSGANVRVRGLGCDETLPLFEAPPDDGGTGEDAAVADAALGAESHRDAGPLSSAPSPSPPEPGSPRDAGTRD